MRRSLRDPEWADRVWDRYQRRRDLPNRQMRASANQIISEIRRSGDWKYAVGIWVGFVICAVLWLLGLWPR